MFFEAPVPAAARQAREAAVAPIPADPGPYEGPPRETELRRFRDLYTSFRSGLTWLNRQYQTHVLPDGCRRYNPELERDIKRFEVKVAAEMDKLWACLTGQEREILETVIKTK